MQLMAIVYATESKILRRMIKFEPNGTTSDQIYDWLTDGECMILMDFDPAMITNRSTVNEAIEQVTGTYPPSGRCCVIDTNGTVTSIIQADPKLDSIPGMTLIFSDEADPGWSWNEKDEFTAPEL